MYKDGLQGTLRPSAFPSIQALEKKLAVARATLAVPLEESGESADATEGLFDIREEYDEALHGPTTTATAGSTCR